MTLFSRTLSVLAIVGASAGGIGRTLAQEPARKSVAVASNARSEQAEKSSTKPELPFQIQLLETKVRFEANGDSRKEVHTIVKIINFVGARQFARIAFDYNRTFQHIEIPTVRVNHANGGTSEVLPSAITDGPIPAAEPFPAYHEVRVKAVRILGLEEGDTIEYRVITSTLKQPLAPDFWLEHSFDRSGQVLEERYELDLPSSRGIEPRINPAAPVGSKEVSGVDADSYAVYHWTRSYVAPSEGAAGAEAPADALAAPDLVVSTFSWGRLAGRLAELQLPGAKPLGEMKTHEDSLKELSRRPEVAEAVREKAISLTHASKNDLERMKAIYQFVSTQITTVDLPLGTTGFHARPAADILNSAYATAEDKYVLFAALATAANLRVDAALTGFCDKQAPAMPTAFKHLVVLGSTKERQHWMDPAVEVAPFGMMLPTPAKCALLLRRDFSDGNAAGQEWIKIPLESPFAAFQKVAVDAALTDDGQLSAKVNYVIRGETELLLRVTFHQTPKDKWKDVANMLAISDGFRAQVANVEVSDPSATDDPFRLQYELTELKFVDWSNKPVRIPALLPQIGLPDPTAAPDPSKPGAKIVLGTPLDVQTSMTLRLPAGTTVQTPAGTSVARDYATYSSKYSSAQNTVVASRRINFLKREILGERAMDYSTFFHAVQSDQSQRIILAPAPDSRPGDKAVAKP